LRSDTGRANELWRAGPIPEPAHNSGKQWEAKAFLGCSGGNPTITGTTPVLKMDLRIVASSFSDTTYKVEPVTDAGQKFLGFGTEFVVVRKSDLPLATRAAAAHGLQMGR